MNKPELILIIGPTAVGKTELAIQLAERFNGEIVSADSRLLYRGMDIGTAKPSSTDRQRVPHHLIDVAEPDDVWSLAIYQKAATNIIGEIHTRRKTPFLVGGTGQYIRAVTEGWAPPEVEPDPRLRHVLEGLVKNNGHKWLHEGLRVVDPISAKNIDARNVRRTIRAMEVILTTGKLFSQQRRKRKSPFELLMVGLTRSREELYARVDERIEAMFEAGLLEEVRDLLEKGYSSRLPSMSAIGYREGIKVVKGELSEQQAKIEIRRATRIFVRRQANWFKQSDPNIYWFDSGKSDVLITIEKFLREKLSILEKD